MYNIKEYFNDNSDISLKNLLKNNIYKYYLKREIYDNHLQGDRNNGILNTTGEDALSQKEVVNV